MSICYERPVLFPNRRATGAQLFELNPQKDVSTHVEFESKLPHQIASANKKSTDLFLKTPYTQYVEQECHCLLVFTF